MDSSNVHARSRRYTADIEDKFRPRTVTLVKDKSGFGFTLRHFIVYPPTSFSSKGKQASNEDPSISLAQWKSDYKNKPMDTIFIREVKEGSPAHHAGLNKGDRIIAINNYPLSGKSYSDIIHLILRSGQTIRLLVVPKEDDILQLYFASSAYQPVDRERKQHKYLVPSYPNSEQSNQLYLQSYGTYPGRIHGRSKSSSDKIIDSRKQIPKNLPFDPNLPCESSPLHASRRKDDDDALAEDRIFQGGCFSEDEGPYNHSKELGNDESSDAQPPELKDTVANFYYSLCKQPTSAVFSLSSEENLNYPIYMSDFDDIVHCDNMEDSSASEALRLAADPEKYAYRYGGPRYGGGKHSCDKVDDAACLCMADSQSSAWTNEMGEGSLQYSVDHPELFDKQEECSSLPPDFRVGEGDASLSINLVAQRRHQFESGDLLAESMGRMNLYRSELSRMSKPNQVRIVSSRAAEFETKSRVALASPVCSYKQSSAMDERDEVSLKGRDLPDSRAEANNYEHFSLDHQNSNETGVQQVSEVHENDSSQSPKSTEFTSMMPAVVHRRKTVPVSSDSDECHIVRRISYLRATANERMNVESDLSEEDEASDGSSPNKEYRIQKLKSFFGEKTPKVKQALQPVDIEDAVESNHQELPESKSVYGWVICKVVSLEGKRSSDRSWRHLWAILRNNILYLLKERREPSKGIVTGDEHVIDVQNSMANIANDYLKRKHVLRLLLFNGTEYLVQTESHASMMEWLKALQIFAREFAELPDWLKNTSVLEKAAAYEQYIQSHKGKSSSQHHHVRKLVFRHRSPSEQSPSVKTRRASQGDELALTKIGVLWRDRMVQGWKKVHGSNTQTPKDASFGVKLENAPPGVTNEHVPLIVELCVQIVENRGLDVVGIYRVPGNNASVSVLTDMVNQGIDDVVLQDARWNDVNIVSSLLKAFFRKLPEPLLTSYLYPKFIQASKIEDPMKRLKAIKHVLYHLPLHYFATLRYLMYHLKKVVEHCATNKMEARNLAIVFGPTLVRTTDNNMVTMVTDMSHQCYLIESMIVYAEWLFEDCGDLLPLEVNAQDKRKTHPPSNMQSNALLSNINKLDESALELPHEIFTSFYNTATRHLRHRNKKKDASINSKKRSGIIADDNEMLIGENMNSSLPLPPSEDQNSAGTEPKSLSDVSFGSCSSLISGSSKTKQRSLSRERRNGSLPQESADPESLSETAAEEDPVHHRYNELSALAQEKIRNFEQETKALLRRDFQRPRTSVGTPQVEWEQIEREWQKAKMELEQEDLLDFLADDPSCLSCLLNRDESAVDVSPIAERQPNRKSDLPGSVSSCSMREFLHCEDSGRFRNSRSPEPRSSGSQSDKTVLNSGNILMPLSFTESYRTKNNRAEMSSSVSQPALTTSISERTANTRACKDAHSSESNSTKPVSDSSVREEGEQVTTGEENVALSCGSDVISASSLS